MKTKKRNVLLILAMMMGLLIAMSTVAFANDDPIPFGDTEYLPTESGTYSLENDVDLREQYVVPAGENITIDLNGKEVIDSDGGDCMIYIGDHDNTVATSLTIKDSAGEGKIFGEDRYNYMVWVTGKGTFTLESGTIQTGSRTLFRVEDDAKIVVNSGKVSTNTESSVVDLYDNSSLTVNGGEVFGLIQLTGNPSVSVSGGLFEMRPNDEWIAEGCTVIDDQGDDYYYKVVKGVSSITLEEKWLHVTEGEREALQATVLPEDAYNRDVIWSSDNEAVATVSDEGVVFGKSCGEATITAKPDGQPGKNVSNDELTATCDVTVYPDIWWKKADNTLYLRAGQVEGYTRYQHPWGTEGYSKVIVENTIRPDDMTDWFSYAKDLEEIVNPENIDTSRVTSMNGLFYGCRNLRSVDMSSWDTSSVTDMRYMFVFCNALTELDLTSFDVSSVQEMTSMFWSCTSLQTIFVSDGSDWATQATQLTDSGTDMFNYCEQLSGGNRTLYDESKTDVTYARVDGGTESPGYFVVPLKVTFEDGMGNVIETKNARYGGSVTAPADPTREGYVFGGWDQDLSNITSETVKATWREIIDNAKVVLSATSLTYNGKVRKPTIKTINGLTLKEGTDYTAKWSNPSSKNVGTYTVTVTGKGKYIGTTKATYKITKAAQSITKVTPASKTYKAVKKTKKLGKTYKFTLKAKGKGSGKVTFKKANKAGASKITVSKAGKVTIKKGLKKGTYKVKVKASKAANTNYTAAAKTVIVKIIVK